MIETYLSVRKTLQGVVLIMDIRRIPAQEELNLVEWLDQCGLPGILVLTKMDKLSKTKQAKQQHSIAETLDVTKDDLILFSAKSRQGKDSAWKAIEKLV
jgi:GTP-binding protein